LANAAGQTYIGIGTLDKKYHPTNKEKIVISRSRLLPILAMKQKAIETGARNKLENNMIPNKVSVVKFLVELGLLSASPDINDEEDGQSGGAGPNFTKKYNTKIINITKNPIGNSTKVKLADARGTVEGIGAQNQCGAAIGSLDKIPRVTCYICGELGKLPNMKTMECEHIFCVGLAAQYFGLLRTTSFSQEQKNVLSILYAWSHRCCNQLKSNLSFMRFKNSPKQNEFEFYETNAKELLRNIYGNTEKYDCKWVNSQITKKYKQKQIFINDRTAVLGRYCRPLISEINEVRTRLFNYNPKLFSFMSILKVAATTLVLLTGDKGGHNDSLYLKSTDTIPLCRLLLLKDLETKIQKNPSRSGGGHQRNKIQYGGIGYDSLSVDEVYNANWGQLMKFMIQSINATNEYIQDRHQVVVDDEHTDYPVNITIHNDGLLKTISFSLDSRINRDALLKSLQADDTTLPDGNLYIVIPINMLPNNITHVNLGDFVSLDEAIRHINSKIYSYNKVNPILSAERPIEIHYYPQGQIQDDFLQSVFKIGPEVLNEHIFNLLLFNHKINPYSLIAALLYNGHQDEYSSNMLRSIYSIIPIEYINSQMSREAASVLLLLELVSLSEKQHLSQLLPEGIKTHISNQTDIINRIRSELLKDGQAMTKDINNALQQIFLIVHPDELPLDELPLDDSKYNEIIQDILTFIHVDDDVKNTKYKNLIRRLLGDNITIFKDPKPQEDTSDYNSDEDGDGWTGSKVSMPSSVSGVLATSTQFDAERGVGTPTNKAKILRIRNLLIVIAGVYFAYGYESFDLFIYNLIYEFETNKISLDHSLLNVSKFHTFKYLLDILTTNLHTNISFDSLCYPIVADFLNKKLILHTNEPPLTPLKGYGDGNYSLSNYSKPLRNEFDSSISESESEPSQILSPASNPSPHQHIDADLIGKLLSSINDSIFTEKTGDSVFDDIVFDNYLQYFTHVIDIQDTYIILMENPPKPIQDAINHIKSFVDSPFNGGKANKKKSTKRRTPRHRQHKRSQYSKKKRNTSGKRNKHVSIKHKKSRTKYHDTRKRRK